MFRDAQTGCMQWEDRRDSGRTTWRNRQMQEQGLCSGPQGVSPSTKNPARQRPGQWRATSSNCRRFMYGLALMAAPTAMAQTCISLADSSQCSAFNSSSISTDSTLTGLFSFLANVSNITSFDAQIEQYIAGDFAEQRYQDLIGCSSFNSSNTTHYYARYTTSVLCNAIVQNSIDACALTGDATRPLCAATCAEYAESEESIAASNYCDSTGSDAISQIRADFTNCALPADSLSGTCISGAANEPDDCGFSSNIGSLCSYCASSSPNSTDSCCVYADTETRCDGVVLPVVATSSMQPLFTSSTPAAASSATSGSTEAATHNRGLTGGQIAGIVIGSILGAFLLLASLILGCIFFRRRQQSSPTNSVFNQPSQARQPQMAYQSDGTQSQRAHLDVLPGGRVARMSALEESSSDSEMHGSSPADTRYPKSSSEDATPRSFPGKIPPPRRKRSGSLSSGSALALGGNGNASPGDTFSSPETTESEQLDFFKDYYSQDEIHPQDLVATLWAYQPHAGDEFELERGDMLKVLGIWDDGWATGVRIRLHAEDWRGHDKIQRDSGLSGSPTHTPEEYGEVKAFPLVCVCLPQHWRTTIEGESTEATGGTIDDSFGSP